MVSPLLPERPDLLLKGPCIAGLLIELPVGFRHSLGPHQAAWREILENRVAFPLPNPSSAAMSCSPDNAIPTAHTDKEVSVNVGKSGTLAIYEVDP